MQSDVRFTRGGRFALLGSPEAAAARGREAVISQGLAAELLGLTRGDILDLMVKLRIPSGPDPPEEARREVEDMRRYIGEGSKVAFGAAIASIAAPDERAKDAGR